MTLEKPTYHMSSVGSCPRAVVAQRLEYDTVEPPEFMQTAAQEGMRHEEWVASDLQQHGWVAGSSEHCEKCQRSGIHVELEFPAFRLVGHMDRTATSIIDGHSRLVEIKSLSRFRAQKLVTALRRSTPVTLPGSLGSTIRTDDFKEEFPEYAMQVSCYRYASNLQILYVVKNRDTGRLNVLPIDAPYNLEEIADYVLELEIQARKGTLPTCRYKRGDFERTICPVKYMCAGEDVEILPKMPEEVDVACENWRRGKELEAESKRLLNLATPILLEAVKASGQKSYSVNNLKLTYIAAGKTITYPKVKLEKIILEELLAQVREERERTEYVRVEEG